MITAQLDELLANAGWYAAPITAGRIEAVYVSTPIRLPGGKSFDFYLIQHGDRIEFTDDGLTMFALRTLGLALQDKRNWRGLRDETERFGFELKDDGTIEANFPENALGAWGGRILQLFSGIAAWELERRNQLDEDFSLTREVERIMRLREPGVEIVFNPRIRVGSGDEIQFDFLWGDRYIETVAPIVQSVNAKLRKAILLSQELGSVDSVLFVVDDRANRSKADHELAILGQVASAIRFTDFAEGYTAN